MPTDRVKTTDSDICEHGISLTQIKQGEKDSAEMWELFFLPIVQAYKRLPQYDEDVYNSAYKVFHEATYQTGEPHSFRCVFIWLRTRVRYFEIIPTWEIERIADNTRDYFIKIEEFRTELTTKYNVPATGIYSEEKLQDMRLLRDEQIAFLRAWALGADEVFDQDGELHRKTLRGLTSEIAIKAKTIENWYF